MPTSNEYHDKAEECFRLANEAKSETDRLACLDLARTWLEAASRHDEAAAERIAKDDKFNLGSNPKRATTQHNVRSGWRQWVLGIFS
jgi:hypothetical protein